MSFHSTVHLLYYYQTVQGNCVFLSKFLEIFPNDLQTIFAYTQRLNQLIRTLFRSVVSDKDYSRIFMIDKQFFSSYAYDILLRSQCILRDVFAYKDFVSIIFSRDPEQYTSKKRQCMQDIERLIMSLSKFCRNIEYLFERDCIK